jgi:hypothetical protein
MTELQRRGRRELLILLAFFGVIFLPGAVWNLWGARHDWRQLGLAVDVLVVLLMTVAGLWRGDRRARYATVALFGLLGTLLILLAVARGRDVIDPNALAVYRQIGLDPLAALYGAGAVCLVGAAALAFSAPIRAYWDCRRAPGVEAPSRTPSGGDPQQAPAAAVTEGSAEASRPPGDCCLACGAPMPEPVARCERCGWTYTVPQGAEPHRAERDV